MQIIKNWAEQQSEVGRHLIETCKSFHGRKPKFIILCECGWMYGTSNRKSVSYMRFSHTYGKSNGHTIQVFEESKDG